ncbi:MAG: DNA polymerase III [Treponematales bacterium]
MFENLIGQSAGAQLASDIQGGVLAPAMLFQGPPASGKGTAALELARLLSCESGGGWNCPCPECARHRLLLHPDLLALGPRTFSAEIAAASAAFLNNMGNAAARLLFIRVARKLLLRFNPALWEEEPKFSKLSPLAASLEEDLDAVPADGAAGDDAETRKLCEGIVKTALKLETEGIAKLIPIDQIRRAGWWSRLAPHGRRKLLLIENAERMKEEAKNSLLKLLEEPPDNVTLVLTSARPEALLPTVLSRLRPCRFTARDSEAETEVLRRVFKAEPPEAGAGTSLIEDYLDSFLPASREALAALAAFFLASVSYAAVKQLRQRGVSSQPEELVLIGKHCAEKAEAAGLGRPSGECKAVIAKVIEGAGNFEPASLFTGFLKGALEETAASLAASRSPLAACFLDIWRRRCAETDAAVSGYNQNCVSALERLFTETAQDIAAVSLSEARP